MVIWVAVGFAVLWGVQLFMQADLHRELHRQTGQLWIAVNEIRDAEDELSAWRTRFPGYRYKDGDIAIQEVVSE